MPHKTPIKGPVRGPVRSNKKLAKNACGLMICRLLHDFGELDEKLKVRSKQTDEECEEELEDDSKRNS